MLLEMLLLKRGYMKIFIVLFVILGTIKYFV